MIVPITDAQLKEIRNAISRSDAEIDQDFAIVKHWLDKQPHLPKTSDDMIKKFLFSLKHRTDKFKTVIDNYYTIREVYPEVYGDLDPTTDDFRKHVKVAHIFPLPKLDSDLSRVTCYRLTKTDPKTINVDVQLKRSELMWNWLFDQDKLTLSNVWVFDLQNMDSIAIWSHFTISFLKKTTRIYTDSKPMRIKRIYYLNMSPIAETTLNIVKQFFPKKIRDRIVFSVNADVLHDNFNLDMLPTEWGGKAGTCEELNEKMHEELMKCKNWCIDLENLKADSSKRIGQSKTADESMLGVEGNFKKLIVD